MESLLHTKLSPSDYILALIEPTGVPIKLQDMNVGDKALGVFAAGTHNKEICEVKRVK
jgi:hypothetical protein